MAVRTRSSRRSLCGSPPTGGEALHLSGQTPGRNRRASRVQVATTSPHVTTASGAAGVRTHPWTPDREWVGQAWGLRAPRPERRRCSSARMSEGETGRLGGARALGVTPDVHARLRERLEGKRSRVTPHSPLGHVVASPKEPALWPNGAPRFPCGGPAASRCRQPVTLT